MFKKSVHKKCPQKVSIKGRGMEGGGKGGRRGKGEGRGSPRRGLGTDQFGFVSPSTKTLLHLFLKLAIEHHNKGFTISTFCRFEVVEDRVGSRFTPTSICLFVYT